eukprot:13065241-Alexandrium_andersonii.AAC.1
MCAKLRRSIYGARPAPARWEALYTETLESFGFARDKANACCFCDAALDARRVVHGEDFTFTGHDEDLDIVEKLMDEKFMCKIEGASEEARRTCRRRSC